MDRWTAGQLALQTIVRWIADGAHVDRAHELIRWLQLNDVVQTEHLFILQALKSQGGSNEELSIGKLRTIIASQDPAGFVRLVLDSMIEARPCEQGAGPKVDELKVIIMQHRETLGQETLKAKRQATAVARNLLAGTIGLVEGAKQLAWTEAAFEVDGELLQIFRKVVLDAAGYPVGPARKLWSSDALARTDRELAELEARARPELEMACQSLINRWGSL